MRLYSRTAHDWTARLAAIATAARRVKAKSFTIDGEAVVLGPDGLSRFEELSSRRAADTGILYAFDLIEHDGEDMRDRPFLDRKAALARLLRNTKAGILFNEHIVEDGAVVFAHACRVGAEGIVSKRVDSTYRSGRCPVWIKIRNPASVAVQRENVESMSLGTARTCSITTSFQPHVPNNSAANIRCSLASPRFHTAFRLHTKTRVKQSRHPDGTDSSQHRHTA